MLFLALRSEADLFLLPEDCRGADLFLAWPRLEDAVSGVFNLFAGLEPVRERPNGLESWVVLVIWLATAGSTEMMEARVLDADSETILTAAVFTLLLELRTSSSVALCACAAYFASFSVISGCS